MEEKAENEVKIKFRNSTYKVMWNCQQSGNFCSPEITEPTTKNHRGFTRIRCI
jgi:hypothetical protein